jgi:acetyltransferase-like isoleucine patch superfamily enzyme
MEKETKKAGRRHSEGPLWQIRRAIKKLHSLWLVWTYPFASVGSRFSAHPSCDLRRSIAGYIRIGDNVVIDRMARVDVVIPPDHDDPVIIIGDGCVLGQRATVTAKNNIYIGAHTILGPSVFITDHNHACGDPSVPIKEQGTTDGGTVRIEDGCWIGFGAAIIAEGGELVVGRNCVIGSNVVLTKSVPPYSIVATAPGRVVKHLDPATLQWTIGSPKN